MPDRENAKAVQTAADRLERLWMAAHAERVDQDQEPVPLTKIAIMELWEEARLGIAMGPFAPRVVPKAEVQIRAALERLERLEAARSRRAEQEEVETDGDDPLFG